MTLPPAGWYDDPNDGSVLRWWDGTDWATPTQPKAPSAPQVAPGWYEDPASPGTTRWWDGDGWGDPPASAGSAPSPATQVVADGEADLVAASAVAGGAVATIVPTVVVEADSTPSLETSAAAALPPVVSYPEHVDDDAATTPEQSQDAVADLTASDETGSPTSAPRRSRRRWVVLGIVVLVVALAAAAAWLVHGKMQESHLADPPSTEAEKNWAIAGDSLGTTLAARGITAAQLPTVCSGGFQDLWDSPLPDAVQGVDENRARKIYVDACTAGFDHPVGLSSPSPAASSKPSTGATAKATSSPSS